MEIPRKLLDSLSDAVNLLSDAAQAQASSAIGRLLAEWDGEDVAALRVACVEALSPVCAEFSDMTAALGAEFYDEVRGMSGAKGAFKARVESGYDPNAYEGGVRAMMDVLVKDMAATDRFEREMLARIDEECRRGANSCVAYNARKDKLKPHYARVPSGSETCGFCMMLASFGFHYKDEDAASHAHKHCDCRVVPDFGMATVEGYDPSMMERHREMCLESIGGRDAIRAEWDAMDEEARDDYIRRHGGKPSKAFQRFLDNRIAEEIETRDAEWFRTGKLPEVEYIKPRSSLLPHERAGVDLLQSHGFKVTTIEEDPNALANLDVYLKATAYEMKNVTNSESSVSNQLSRIRRKAWLLGKPGEGMGVITMIDCDDAFDDVVKAVSERNGYREIIVIKDNRMLRIRK